MALRVIKDIPYGNARAVSVSNEGDAPEVVFAADPRGGAEALWFCMRLTETAPEETQAARLRLTLKHLDTLAGVTSPNVLLPVYHASGHGWHRASAGVVTQMPDGRSTVTWTLPYPAPTLDVALCFPYGKDEVASLISKSKGYWHSDAIGLTQNGRRLTRLADEYGKEGGTHRGLYIVARQRPGETPGSWLLDGLLQRLSRERRNPFLTWCVPVADVDGAARGQHSGTPCPRGIDRGWTAPPLRHECRVMQSDIANWRARCRPYLALDFCAADACETNGIYALLPPEEINPDLYLAAEKCANVIKGALGDLAAKDFKRPSAARTAFGAGFAEYMVKEAKVCALTIKAPYAKIGSTVLTVKQYREAGQLIAKALLSR